jgi:diadenosine tetraphosphate (Ap4A) HIT family hydrolase
MADSAADGATHAARILWRDAFLRVVVAGDPEIPAFLRVIWNAHVREMSDLPVADRARLMRTVLTVEEAMRQVLAPDKINLASLGNLVPHLHWHVIPRFGGDTHFPQPVWGARQRAADPVLMARQHAALPALQAQIARQLDGWRAQPPA